MNKRITEVQTPIGRWRRKIENALARPLGALSENQRFWLGFALASILTALFIQNPLWRLSPVVDYRKGDIVREDIIAPADISFVNPDEAERKRIDAKTAVKPIFRFEATRGERAVQGFTSAWEKMQRQVDESKAHKTANSNSQIPWSGMGGEAIGSVLGARVFSKNEIDAVQSALRESATGFIYDDAERQYFEREVLVFDKLKPGQQTIVSMPETNWTPLSAARENLMTRLAAIKSFSPREIDAFAKATEILVEPTVSYDSVATESLRQSAIEGVQLNNIALKRGQKIASEGDIVTDEMLLRIAAVRNHDASSRLLNRFIGVLLFVAGLFWVAWKFVQHRGIVPRLALSSQKTFALLAFIVVIQTALTSFLFTLAEYVAIQNVRAPFNDATIWSFAIPFATGSLLMTLLADRPTALFTGFLNAVIAGFLAPRGMEFVVFAAIASSVAVYGIGRYRSRQTVTMAGILVGLASGALALVMLAYTQQPIVLNTVLAALACGFASGFITAAVTSVMLPICETTFGILTDVKLLELSNADLPALGQLALRAPGTNQHSHAVGQLAEEASRAIGANALLTRIGALYHDIGKTAAPEHFVENQLAKNPHDKLKPTQSAKIIISHVTYGIKLAKELGLPQRIIDFIPQHHGTRTLHYFLKKAQAEAQNESDVSENDFRYPGPKPQFKEAAIMMIADSCEAAARSLAEPNPANIRFIVTKIVDAIIADDQLGECDLTLREVTQIRESMIKSLVAIYHSRIDYPGYVPPATGQFRLVGSDEGAQEESVSRYLDPKDIPISPGGEIEDEAFDRTNEPNASGFRAA
jgi:cyclic-di-AMP phosphodiesterase PgpH